MLTALFFMAGLAVALSLLYLLAWILLASVKKYFTVRAPFVWRHALSGVYRPGNQTWLLTVTLGLSAFLLGTLNAVEESLLSQVEFTGRTNQSNTILFDIQPHQKDSVVGLLSRNHLPLRQLVPIVTCRITELKGRGVEAWQNDTINRLPNWALTREYRVTYRDSLHLSEQLVRGELQRHRPGQPDSVWITISEGMDENLQVDVGDTLVFDVQGVPLKARISGIRKVEWPKDPPNFIFVFPTGVLEQAPRIYVAATSVGSEEQAARLQLQLISSFPNVSVIDLRLVLSTINELFNKVGGIISALALFSLAAGLVVLAGMVLASRFVRQRENVLLRTLGATSATVTGITLIEYLYIGLFATATGMGLALGGGYAVAVFFFDINFAFRIAELVTVAGIIVLLTVAVGWLNTRQILYTPPLEILRKE
jgi:putative ABC transport system permease protein